MKFLAALLSFALTSAAVAAGPGTDGGMMGVPGTVPGTTPAPVAAEPAPYGKAEGIIPGMVIGPKLALLPAPAIYGIGLEAKFGNLLGVGLDYNAWPTLKVGNLSAGYNDIQLAARLFPWKGRFYLGAALGQRNFFAKATDPGLNQEVKVEVKSTYLAPEIGWRFVSSSGFFMGIDLGYQIVLSPKLTLTVPPGTVDPETKKDAEDFGSQIGKVGFPIVSLLQFGFYL